jgi:hypothetical protein
MVTGLSLTRVYLIYTLLLAELKNVDPVRSCGQVSQRVRLQHAQEAQDYRRLSRLCSLHWNFPGKKITNHESCSSSGLYSITFFCCYIAD